MQSHGGLLPQPLPGRPAAEGSGRGPAAGARGPAAGRERAQEPSHQARHGRPLHRVQGEGEGAALGDEGRKKRQAETREEEITLP